MEFVCSKVPAFSVEFYRDKYLIAGIGPIIRFFNIRDSNEVFSLRIPNKFLTNVKGIIPFTENVIFAFGQKCILKLLVAEDKDGKLNAKLMYVHLCKDWVLDIVPFYHDELKSTCLLVGYSHNFVEMLCEEINSDENVQLKVGGFWMHEKKTFSSALSLILHPNFHLNHRIFVASGVTYDVHVWCVDISKPYSEKKVESLLVLKGHEGLLYRLRWNFDVVSERLSVLSCSDDRFIRYWEISLKNDSISLIRSVELAGHLCRPWDARVICSKEKETDFIQVISCGQDPRILLWNIYSNNKAKCTKALRGHNGLHIWSVCSTFTQDGLIAASAGNDSGVFVWDLSELEGSDCSFDFNTLGKVQAVCSTSESLFVGMKGSNSIFWKDQKKGNEGDLERLKFCSSTFCIVEKSIRLKMMTAWKENLFVVDGKNSNVLVFREKEIIEILPVESIVSEYIFEKQEVRGQITTIPQICLIRWDFNFLLVGLRNGIFTVWGEVDGHFKCMFVFNYREELSTSVCTCVHMKKSNLIIGDSSGRISLFNCDEEKQSLLCRRELPNKSYVYCTSISTITNHVYCGVKNHIFVFFLNDSEKENSLVPLYMIRIAQFVAIPTEVLVTGRGELIINGYFSGCFVSHNYSRFYRYVCQSPAERRGAGEVKSYLTNHNGKELLNVSIARAQKTHLASRRWNIDLSNKCLNSSICGRRIWGVKSFKPRGGKAHFVISSEDNTVLIVEGLDSLFCTWHVQTECPMKSVDLIEVGENEWILFLGGNKELLIVYRISWKMNTLVNKEVVNREFGVDQDIDYRISTISSVVMSESKLLVSFATTEAKIKFFSFDLRTNKMEMKGAVSGLHNGVVTSIFQRNHLEKKGCLELFTSCTDSYVKYFSINMLNDFTVENSTKILCQMKAGVNSLFLSSEDLFICGGDDQSVFVHCKNFKGRLENVHNSTVSGLYMTERKSDFLVFTTSYDQRVNVYRIKKEGENNPKLCSSFLSNVSVIINMNVLEQTNEEFYVVVVGNGMEVSKLKIEE